MYSELTLQDVSFLILYGGASVLAVLAQALGANRTYLASHPK